MKNPHSISMHTFGSQKRKAFLCWMTLVCASHVFAQTTADEWQPGQIVSLNVTQSDPHNEVQKALRQAKYPLALKLIEQALTKNPRDPQMLFWKAYVVEKQNQPELAQPIYLDLTQQLNLKRLCAATPPMLWRKKTWPMSCCTKPACCINAH